MKFPAPRAWTRHGSVSIALPVLLASAVLLPLLGHRPLTAWDEGIYAEIAREMASGGSWWVPHWNGALWFEKPPLALWLTACSLRLFGVNTWAARLPSALAGVTLTAVLYGWLRRHFGSVTAWAGAVLLLCGFGFQHAARAGETDTLLSLFCFLGVLGLTGVLRGQRRGWLLFWVAFALAFMTKGAAAATLPLTALALAMSEGRQLLRFRRMCGRGILLWCALVLPWHAALWWQYRGAFLREYLGLHVLQRAAAAIEGHKTPPWFFLWVLLISTLPWALLYPFAVAAPFRSGAPGRERSLRALSVFALLTLIFFSAAQTRLPHYIDPVYAPLAGLTAVWLVRWAQSQQPLRRKALVLAAIAAYAAGAALTGPARRRLHSARLPNGQLTPDNREAAALLGQARQRATGLPPGPLLIWRKNADAPVTTDAFYSQRLVAAVGGSSGGSSGSCAGSLATGNRYALCPAAWTSLRPQPYLLLVQGDLAESLPPGWSLEPVATGVAEEVGILRPRTGSIPR